MPDRLAQARSRCLSNTIAGCVAPGDAALLCRFAQQACAPSLRIPAILAPGLQPMDSMGPPCHTLCTPAPGFLAYLTHYPHPYSCRLKHRRFTRSQHVPNCTYESAASTLISVIMWRVLNMQICDRCRKVGSMLTIRFENVPMSYPSVRRLQCGRPALEAQMLELCMALHTCSTRRYQPACTEHTLPLHQRRPEILTS